MATEKLSATISVKVEKDQAEKELERLKSPIGVKMAIDLWEMRQKLVELRKDMKDAFKTGNLWLAKEIWWEVEIAKKQVTLLNRELTNFTRTWDKNVSVLWNLFKQVGIDIESWFWKAITRVSQSVSDFFSWSLFLVWAWFITAWIKSIGESLLYLWDQLEQSSIAFWTILWDADKAKTLLSDLSIFASNTPFEIWWIRSTAKQLLAFWIESEKIIPTLKSLGDVASGTSTPIENIAYAYWQVRTANQLYGTELRQFTNAGVPLLAELASMFSVTEQAARKMVEDWKIWFADVEEAFQRMTSEWGRFNGLMEKQSTTLTGQVSNLKDKFSILWESIWLYFIPVAKQLIWFVSSLVDFFQTTIWKTILITTAVGVLGYSMMWLTAVIIGLSSAFSVAAASGWILAWVMAMLGWPVSLVIAWIAAISGWFFLFSQSADWSSQATKDLNSEFASLEAQTENLKNKQAELQKQYDDWSISADEYKESNKILGDQLAANIATTEEYKKWIDILNAWHLNYAEKIDMINWLKLNDSQYNLLIARNRELQAELINSIKLQKQLLMSKQQVAEQDFASAQGKLPSVSAWGALATNSISQAQLNMLDVAGQKRNKIIEESNKEIAELEKQRLKLEKETAEWENKIRNTSASSAKRTWSAIASSAKRTWSAVKKAEEDKTKAMKESVEKQKDFFKKMIDQRKSDIKSIEDYVDKLKKAYDDIGKIEEDINKTRLDSTQKTTEASAQRYRTILEEIKTEEKTLKESTDAIAASSAWREVDWATAYENQLEAQKNITELRNQADEIINSWLLDQNAKAKEDQRASLWSTWKSRFDYLEQISKIQTDEANQIASLQQQKNRIETEIWLKKEQIQHEIALQQDRINANQKSLQAYQDVVEGIEKGITNTTEIEISKRMLAYRAESEKLKELISLRMQAWYVTTRPNASVTNNTVNNTPNVSVNATISNTVDLNMVSNTLAQKILLSSKWIS